PAGPISLPPSSVAQPTYNGNGQLLAGGCSTPAYTLVQEGNMVYQALFVGCQANRPECCPWNVSAAAGAAAAR
ncbi:hypothetical protein B0T26DRAFT_615241, partial [Lasiosphaeria miniovina]